MNFEIKRNKSEEKLKNYLPNEKKDSFRESISNSYLNYSPYKTKVNDYEIESLLKKYGISEEKNKYKKKTTSFGTILNYKINSSERRFSNFSNKNEIRNSYFNIENKININQQFKHKKVYSTKVDDILKKISLNYKEKINNYKVEKLKYNYSI